MAALSSCDESDYDDRWDIVSSERSMSFSYLSLIVRKSVFHVSDQVRQYNLTIHRGWLESWILEFRNWKHYTIKAEKSKGAADWPAQKCS